MVMFHSYLTLLTILFYKSMKNIILLCSSQYLMMVITHNSYVSNNANHATYKDADDWGWFIIVKYFMMVITHNSFSILQYPVVGLDHFLPFFPYIGIIVPTDFHIFQGRYTTNQ